MEPREKQPSEDAFKRIVTLSRELYAAQSGPAPGKFHTLDIFKVYGMTVPRLAKLSLVSEAYLYFCLIGKCVPSRKMAEHIANIVKLDPHTFVELCKACKHERKRRFGEIDEECRIPPPLFHYFKEIKGIGASPKMEGKYKEMVEQRRGKSRKAVMRMGSDWFEHKAKQIAEQSGFVPDKNGVYRKNQSASVVQTLTEVLGTAGLDEGGPGSV